MLLPEDYPFTGSTEFLVSSRIANILKGLNVSGVDYYESEIIRPNQEVLKGFVTINITNRISCLDKEKSIFSIRHYGPAEVYKFKKISLDSSRIPEGVKLFRLEEQSTLVIAHQMIKERFEKDGITGVKFEPVDS